jgi:hypothetical protein
MFPVHTPEMVRAEQSRRLEGFRLWSRRRGQSDGALGVDYAPRQEKGHHPTTAIPALSH